MMTVTDKKTYAERMETLRFTHPEAAAALERLLQENEPYPLLLFFGNDLRARINLKKAVDSFCAEKEKKLISSSQTAFFKDLYRSLCEGRSSAFYDPYLEADLLIVDDLEFFAGRQASEEALYYCLRRRIEAKRPTVLMGIRNKDLNLNESLNELLKCGEILPLNRE